MNTERFKTAWNDKVERGLNGRRLCRWCRTEVPKGRRTFCSQPCVDEWLIRSSSSHVRALVFKRDKGICAACGLDTDRFYDSLHVLLGVVGWHRQIQIRREQGIPLHRCDLWDADHIVPVIEGGGQCGLENYRTLCIWCHRIETKALHGRRAERRRGQTNIFAGADADMPTAGSAAMRGTR